VYVASVVVTPRWLETEPDRATGDEDDAAFVTVSSDANVGTLPASTAPFPGGSTDTSCTLMEPMGSPVTVDLIQQNLVCTVFLWISKILALLGSAKDDVFFQE
jgi:hypothetical protein